MTTRQFRSAWLGLVPACSLLLCSCASGWKTADVDPFVEEGRRDAAYRTDEAASAIASPTSPAGAHSATTAAAAAQSQTSDARPHMQNDVQNAAVQTVSLRGQSDDAGAVRLSSRPMRPAPLQPASHTAAHRTADASGDFQVSFTPAEPRDDLAERGIVPASATACPLCATYHDGGPCPPHAAPGYACPPASPYCGPHSAAPVTAPWEYASYFPDEYLCDGGDRALPVHYDRFHRNGLDTEDAIAEYSDHLGRRHMQPTNKVCVYAPRFGAMRTVSSPELGYNIEVVASAAEQVRGVGLKTRLSPVDHSQRLQLEHMRVRSRVSGLNNDLAQSGVGQTMHLHVHEKLINVYEDLTFLSSGQFVQQELAQLAAGIQYAAVWTRAENPVVAAQTATAQQVEVEFRPQEIVGLEEKQAPGELRIIKLADRKTAQPGDIITFTIRYDNIGERELYHVHIIDNLTPRLEYVEDSATSDRAGKLVVVDNEEGSLILKFEMDEPLPGGQGGVVTFQTKVR